MIYRFIIKGYYDIAYFDVQFKNKIELDNYKYIRFSSYENAKIVYHFYKEEICQGGKPSKGSVISNTGFFDCGYQHWTQFEPFNKRIVYQYNRKDNGIIELIPLNIGDTYHLNSTDIIDF